MSFIPSIFVGAGGVGKNILLRIRRMIVENHGSLENLPSIRFLHIDTDQNKNVDGNSTIPLSVLGQNIEITGAEQIDLGVTVSKAIKDDPIGVQRQTSEWLNGNKWLKHTFTQGAGSIRPHGKLAFQYSVDKFRNSLSQAVSTALSPFSKTTTATTLGTTADGDCNVYVVCSLLGGTGSGSFLEICYNVRKILATNFGNINPHIIGVFVIGGMGIKKENEANCYSALQELEYFTTAVQTGEQEKYWWAHYPSDPVRFTSRDFPTDLCYLVSHLGEGGNILERDKLEETVAFNLFLDFDSAIADNKRRTRNDLIDHQAFLELDEGNTPYRSRRFLTFGLSVLEFPAPRVKEWVTHSLAERTINRWLFESTQIANQDVLRTLNNFIKENNIDAKELVSTLLTGLEPKIRKEIDTNESKLNGIIKETLKANLSSITTDAKDYIEEVKSKTIFSNDIKKRGVYVESIRSEADRWLTDLKDKLKNAVNKNIEDMNESYKYALAFLNGLAREIEIQKEKLFRQLQQVKTLSEKLEAEVESEEKIFDKNSSFKESMRKSNQWLHKALLNYSVSLLRKEAHQAALNVLSENNSSNLLVCVQELINDIENYKSKLNELKTDFTNRKKEVEQSLTAGLIDYGITLTTQDLEAIKNRIVVPNYTKNDLEESTMLSAINDHTGKVKDFLIQKCNKLSSQSIGEESIAQILVARDGNVRRVLTHIHSQSKILLNIATHIPNGGGIIEEWLATANPIADVHLLNLINNHINQIHPYNDSAHLKTLNERYRIIFAEEKGVFPLRCINHLKGYEDEFKKLKPPSTFKNIDFPLLFPQENNIEDEKDRVFRERIRQDFQKEFATDLYFINYATKVVDLTIGKSEQILSDEKTKLLGNKKYDGDIFVKTYQDIFTIVISKGSVTKKERLILKEKQRDLGLSDTQIAEIEKSFEFIEEQ